MPVAEAPAVEDEIVLCHLAKAVIKRLPGRGRQKYAGWSR